MKKYQNIIDASLEAKKFSYSPFSMFRVGCAVLSQDNRIFTGCNIENSSYSLTICAERVALFKAISEGCTKFQAIAISADSEDLCPPCGSCRQVIYELAGNVDVILTNGKISKIFKMKKLLPVAFDSNFLK